MEVWIRILTKSVEQPATDAQIVSLNGSKESYILYGNNEMR